MNGGDGLGGHSSDYTQLVWIVATLFGSMILALLAVAYRRARSQRELEEAERVIAEAFPDDPA
jgi:hypothetical protein